MAWCLLPVHVEKFKEDLRNGEIDPIKLAGMSSLERHKFFSGKFGEENATNINSLFESKLLLKNQIQGYKSWIKRVGGFTKQTKMDLISRIERMDKVLNPKEEEQFLQDLASTRLKIDVTQEEAKKITDLSKKVQETKLKANEEGKFSTESERLEYGTAKVNIENYVNNLKIEGKKPDFEQTVGISKSLVASLDNSFFGRQGIKTLYTRPTVWLRAFLKSWKDIALELKGQDAINLIKADIYSRPNALNGKYQAGRYGLDVLSEEAYPSSLPEKIPLLGRLFKASESAYNGGALRIRADLADGLIKLADESGVNTLNREEAKNIGNLVGSLTGRGNLGKADVLAKEFNVLLFSVKFMKSNIDTLIAPAKYAIGKVRGFENKGAEFASKQSAKSTLKIVTTIASLLTIARLLNPDSVDKDPRSQNFGKIKVFGHWVDITGGMASLVSLASRLVPTVHNGEWGLWKKSSTGNWTNLTAREYGQGDGFDLLVDSLFSNKLSPTAGLLRDAWKGEHFGGEKFNIKSALLNLVTPLSIQNFNQLKDDPDSSSVLGSMILEALGFSTSTYRYKADWTGSNTKEMKQFKEKVGDDKFKQANNDFNRAYSEWYTKAKASEEFNKLSEDGKKSTITKAKAEIKDKIFKEYNFRYKEEKKTPEQKEETKIIKELIDKTI